MRRLCLILGDQLHPHPPVLDDFDPAHAHVLMIEAVSESTYVWTHPAKITLFLSAMRHYRDELRGRGVPLHYQALSDAGPEAFADRLALFLDQWQPEELVMVEAGECRLEEDIRAVCLSHGVRCVILDDPHFYCSRAEFAEFARGKKRLLMENFYRKMRQKHGVLMAGEEPVGGQWNFDKENRKSFGKAGPGLLPPPYRPEPDDLTRTVMQEVSARFPDHPGSLEAFRWPVTRSEALQALAVFIETRLVSFGDHQDAMWTDEPFLSHALISPALNLKLLDPREVVARAEEAYRAGKASLASVEGFIRQVLGWREFIRGVYYLDMPGLRSANHFNHARPLPSWYWTGKTKMHCLSECVSTTLKHGYAHHIQRLMVTGLFGLIAEIEPQAIADWYLAVYIDALEWVELPNVMGMALFANGGRFTTKPYAASGAYIKRMSNYCQSCAYRPEQKTGENACPLTVFYWNFIDRHEASFARDPRTALMVKNLQRMAPNEREAIRADAKKRLNALDSL